VGSDVTLTLVLFQYSLNTDLYSRLKSGDA